MPERINMSLNVVMVVDGETDCRRRLDVGARTEIKAEM